MKKLIFASAALCAAATISAQEVAEAQANVQSQSQEQEYITPSKYKGGSERFGAEAGLSLGNGFSLSGGNLNCNYSLSDELTVRLGFGLNVTKSAEKDSSDNKGHETETSFDIKPGIVYSFSGTERLEPYVGAEVVFGFDSNHTYGEGKFDGKTIETTEKTKTNHFGANAFTGFNFYVAKDLYVGAELGFGFIVTPDKRTTGKDAEGKEYDSKDNNMKAHVTNINVNCNPAVRVGWKF